MLKQAPILQKTGESLSLHQLLWANYQGGQTGYHFLDPMMVDIPTTNVTSTVWQLRIASVLSMLKSFDADTASHCQRVSKITLALGIELGLPTSETKYLRWGGLLHDIGKIAIDPQIKNKPGKLTREEYGYIKTHAMVGALIAQQVMGDKVAKMIEHHHDYYDGNGHNQSVVGEDIPLGARIIAVADAFDAMVFDRPYRFAMTRERAGEEIRQCANTQFDPRVVKGLINIMR